MTTTAPRCSPLVYGTEQCRQDDYRYSGDAVLADRQWDKYKRWTPAQRADLRDRILMSAAAQDQLFVVVDDQRIEEGYRCAKCGMSGKHDKRCEPPRGLLRA